MQNLSKQQTEVSSIEICKLPARTRSRAFTIIELLIVIVIIGVLVAIVAVSYGGITKSAKEASLKSDLRNANTTLEMNKAKDGVYPTDASGLKSSNDSFFSLSTSIRRDSYCLSISPRSPNSQNIPTYNVSSGSNDIKQGDCLLSGDIPIQTITKSNCPSSRTMVIDARDSHTYWVQKLADGNCWMMTNLAYAGGGLNTYGDTIATLPTNRFSLGNIGPSYGISSWANVTTNPVAPSSAMDGGSSIAGRQFGYLYNFCGANGAQSGNGACSETSSSAVDTSVSVCPAGWRLPTGSASGEFKALNDAANGGKTDTDSGLVGSGAMLQRGGFTDNGTTFQFVGTIGTYWSSTQASNPADGASALWITATSVDNVDSTKALGMSVRCVAR